MKIPWMTILFLGVFTFSIYICFRWDYNITKNIFFVIGIIASYLLVILASEEASKEEKKG